MAEIIEEMAKYSKVKKPGIFARAGEALKGAVSGIFTERSKDMTAVIDSIKLSDTSASFPPEVQASLTKIKAAKIWDKDFLAKLDPKVIKHIDGLSKSINNLIAQESKISGARNALNAEYQNWMAAFSDFEKMVEDYSLTIAKTEVIQEASVDKQKDALGISETENANESLLSAFAYMGMEIKQMPDGSYDFAEIADRGFPYQDASGKTQYIRISEKAARAFVDNYFANGGMSHEKEDRALELEEEALANMRDNQRAGGVDAPTDADIAKQERRVEQARKAVEAVQAQTITPKGLFKYFVEQELIAGTSKRKVDRESLMIAQNTFNVDGPEWEAFEMTRDAQTFMDDLSFVGLSSLYSMDMDLHAKKNVPQYDDFLESKASDTFSTRRVVNKLERDAQGVIDQANSQYDANQDVREATIDKYKDVVARLEKQVGLYQKQGTPVPPNLQASLESMRDRVETIESFENVMGDIRIGIAAGQLPNAPDNLKSDNLALVEEVRGNLEFDGSNLTLKADLVNSTSGEVWLTKDQFDGLMLGMSLEQQVQQTPDHEVDMMPDVLEASLNQQIIVGPGREFPIREILEREAMYNRALALIDDGKAPGAESNAIYDMYKDYVQVVKEAMAQNQTPPTAEDYLKAILAQQQSIEGAEQDGHDLCGLFTQEILATAFDVRGKQEPGISTPENNTPNPNAFRINTDASLAYFYMDLVSQSISQDPALLQQYLDGNEAEQSAIFSSVYADLKKNGKLVTPRPNQRHDAQRRWKSYYQFTSDNHVLSGMQNSPDFTNSPAQAGIAKAMARVLERDKDQFGKDLASLEAEGKSLVDHDIESESEKEVDDSKKEFSYFFPRGTPQFKIAKNLQPFNIKAGLKFMDQIVEAFQKVQVKNPWPKLKKQSEVLEETDELDNSGANASTNTSAANSTATTDGPTSSNGLFDGLDDNQVQNRIAMMSVGMGVNSILDKLDLDQDADAPQVRAAMDYMTTQGAEGQPKVKVGDQEIILSDAMQRVLINEFATGAKDEAGARESIEGIVSQLDPKSPLVPMVQSMSVLMGTLSPAELVQMLSMTAETPAPKEGEPMSIEMGSKLTPEYIAQFRKLKDISQIREMIEQSELYDQTVINNIFEAGNLMRHPEAGMEIN